MTKKDYISLAEAINIAVGNPEIEAIKKLIAQRIAEVLAKDNSRFDYTKFLGACGILE